MIAFVAVVISSGVNSARTFCARVCKHIEAHHFVVFVVEDVAFKPHTDGSGELLVSGRPKILYLNLFGVLHYVILVDV